MLWLTTHGREPFKGVEDLLLFPILELVNDLGFFWNICHFLLGKGGSVANNTSLIVQYIAISTRYSY